MNELVVPVIAAIAALLTFFSGFGLGTLLLPAFALFYPPEIAVAATAIVHLANNLLKFSLTARHAKVKVLLKFGIPAVIFGFAGAMLLVALETSEPLFSYHLAGGVFEILPLKLIIGMLMIGFAFLEKLPAFTADRSSLWMSIGGALSGFFGGLSGHQGALRSSFLSKSDLNAAQFIGTTVTIAVAVDVVRLLVYSPWQAFAGNGTHFSSHLLLWSIVAALAGTLIGRLYLKKIRIEFIRKLVTILLAAVGVLLAAGIL